jgi:hypothetical protein
MQDDLNVATADKLTKDGEVSWLRKSIEKVSHHAITTSGQLKTYLDSSRPCCANSEAQGSKG